MKAKFKLAGLVLMAAVAHVQLVVAEAPSILITGRLESNVLGPTITLGDVAQLSSNKVTDDEKILNIRKVIIQNSPAPGESTAISAVRVLEILDRAGINRREIGYSFPRIMKVTRASRVLTSEEIKEAINQSLERDDKERVLKSVFFDKEIHVAPGLSSLRAIPLSNTRNRYTFSVTVSVEGEKDIRFTVPCEVEEWATMPVASRPMSKGEIVRSEDLMMARLNVDALPPDAAPMEKFIVGYELNSNVGAGEAFKKRALKIPPVVLAGSKVTLMFAQGLLSATATGTALEEGIEGQRIKVQNDSSKRVVMAHVVEPGLVKVEVQ